MSLGAGLKLSRNLTPGKVAVVFREQSWTYAEFDDLTDNLARNLLAAGVEAGDRVAFHLPNGPELALGYFGCFKAGCIAVPINTRLKGPEIDYILRQSGSACYIGDADYYGDVIKSCPAIRALELRYLVGGDPKLAEGTAGFNDLLLLAAGSFSAPGIAPDRTAAILYTSGTTDKPKGVTHSHASLTQTAHVMREICLDEHQVVLVMSSMSHMIGFAMLFLSGLLNGATVAITQPLDFQAVLSAFARWRCTYTVGVPVMFQGLLQAQEASPHDVSSGRFYFCGGDCVSPVLQEAFEHSIGPICEVYGATEMAPASWNRPGQVRIGSIGRPGEGMSFRLADSSGREVKPGEVGEICVRGSHLMTGYWQDANATSIAMRDGWFHTGDLARCDSNGDYWFSGRKKEIIVRGGSNISPQEVEAVLYQHPAVKEAGVVGRPDPVWGETVSAFVALRATHFVTELELIAFARERLADYKTPEVVIFRDELPKNSTGKIQRRALRQTEHATPAV
jgi:long-chain acyl-CoA synthetase